MSTNEHRTATPMNPPTGGRFADVAEAVKAATGTDPREYGVFRVSPAGVDVVVWADNVDHLFDLTRALYAGDAARYGAIGHADLPIYPTPVYVGADVTRIPDHLVAGKRGRIVVALG